FLDTVAALKDFFERRAERLGKPIRYVIKTGIGGQHTPFQGIADVFQLIDVTTGVVVGEYELGKNYKESLRAVLATLDATWDQIAIIPSSKSGSTDETMIIFDEILAVLLEEVTTMKGYNGDMLTDAVFAYLHDLNFPDGIERSGKDLFKGFSFTDMMARINHNVEWISEEVVRDIFGIVLGNMFFETTDRSSASRLSAFVRNSGLDKELGDDAPGFGAMFDNVGGRWTGDLHMMTFLAYHGLDPKIYWEIRQRGIQDVRARDHVGVMMGNYICDHDITDIALVVPNELFWFGKSIEQNYNESIWQKGFANLVVIKASEWERQKQHYYNKTEKIVINYSTCSIPRKNFNCYDQITAMELSKDTPPAMAAGMFAALFTTFYGMTYTVGNRLIARAIREAGWDPSSININDLSQPATKILQENLYLRQPYVELGKKLLEERLSVLQKKQNMWEADASPQRTLVSPIGAAHRAMVDSVAQGIQIQSNIPELQFLMKRAGEASSMKELAEIIAEAYRVAEKLGRKFVPFIYLEGDKYAELRKHLVDLGVEWVIQGTGDQHISYQQVLSQPQKYLPFFISAIPKFEDLATPRPAIGFAKGYLHNISPHLVRHYFAEASYQALTDLRAAEGGLGVFVSMRDSKENRDGLKTVFGPTGGKQVYAASFGGRNVMGGIVVGGLSAGIVHTFMIGNLHVLPWLAIATSIVVGIAAFLAMNWQKAWNHTIKAFFTALVAFVMSAPWMPRVVNEVNKWFRFRSNLLPEKKGPDERKEKQLDISISEISYLYTAWGAAIPQKIVFAFKGRQWVLRMAESSKDHLMALQGKTTQDKTSRSKKIKIMYMIGQLGEERDHYYTSGAPVTIAISSHREDKEAFLIDHKNSAFEFGPRHAALLENDVFKEWVKQFKHWTDAEVTIDTDDQPKRLMTTFALWAFLGLSAFGASVSSFVFGMTTWWNDVYVLVPVLFVAGFVAWLFAGIEDIRNGDGVLTGSFFFKGFGLFCLTGAIAMLHYAFNVPQTIVLVAAKLVFVASIAMIGVIIAQWIAQAIKAVVRSIANVFKARPFANARIHLARSIEIRREKRFAKAVIDYVDILKDDDPARYMLALALIQAVSFGKSDVLDPENYLHKGGVPYLADHRDFLTFQLMNGMVRAHEDCYVMMKELIDESKAPTTIKETYITIAQEIREIQQKTKPLHERFAAWGRRMLRAIQRAGAALVARIADLKVVRALTKGSFTFKHNIVSENEGTFSEKEAQAIQDMADKIIPLIYRVMYDPFRSQGINEILLATSIYDTYAVEWGNSLNIDPSDRARREFFLRAFPIAVARVNEALIKNDEYDRGRVSISYSSVDNIYSDDGRDILRHILFNGGVLSIDARYDSGKDVTRYVLQFGDLRFVYKEAGYHVADAWQAMARRIIVNENKKGTLRLALRDEGAGEFEFTLGRADSDHGGDSIDVGKRMSKDEMKDEIWREYTVPGDDSLEFLFYRITEPLSVPITNDPILREYFTQIGGQAEDAAQLALFIEAIQEVMNEKYRARQVRSSTVKELPSAADQILILIAALSQGDAAIEEVSEIIDALIEYAQNNETARPAVLEAINRTLGGAMPYISLGDEVVALLKRAQAELDNSEPLKYLDNEPERAFFYAA
ncbi:MAG: hypothetical protein JW938_01800, partial [Candidatus Omnitrophica bacterium]|nr:hypothetical protein [Candidatus Omnitrophota bacterium]